MKSIVKVTLSAFGLVILGPLAGFGFQEVERSTSHRNTLTFDLAVDCRTFVGGDKRGDIIILNGKIFPAGTLASGTASNDPTQAVNGVAPIGDWLLRGQHAFPLPVPDDIAQSYRSAPGDFGTAYFILDEGRTALITETYAFLDEVGNPSLAFSAVTGGIGSFRGASGEIQMTILGINATGCPNSRGRVILVPRSVRGASDK